MRGGAMLLALLLHAGSTLAQLANENCSYADGQLCVPKFCEAPKAIGQQVSPAGKTHYTITSKSGKVANFTPVFGGYELDVFCSDVRNADGRASSAAKPYPKGCQPISPLPTLDQSVDREFILLWLVAIVYLFYALAMVCEEFLVPAINIVCEKTGIPDDVAGATLLAAGCNSPEFFSSIIGIFVADSTVGVGTVVGSAPFNVCCITAGAAFAVGGNLYLDPWLMGRELIALFIAMCLFLEFMADYVILWWEALIMFMYYVCIYVPVLGYFDRIKQAILRLLLGKDASVTTNDLIRASASGAQMLNAATGSSVKHDDQNGDAAHDEGQGGLRGALAASISLSIQQSQRIGFPVPKTEDPIDFAHDQSVGIELRPLGSVKSMKTAGDAILDLMPETPFSQWANLVEECKKRLCTYPDWEAGYSGVLLKKPRGFTKVMVFKVAFQERWFVIDNHPTNPLRYSHVDNKERFVTIPLQLVSKVERISLDEIRLISPEQTYKLRCEYGKEDEAMMQRWFDHIVVKLDEVRKAAPPPKLMNEEDEAQHEHGPWYQVPETPIGKALFCVTFPVKALVFCSTPNVLVKGNEKYFVITILVSMFWLALFAILMTDCIEYLGCGIGVETTVMGLSFGAVGTSFPNLYASILVAKSGQGAMSICQAIASNTFNICICLGFLWVLHSIGLGECDYGSHGNSHRGNCGGCYPPSGFEPLCPFFKGDNNQFGREPGSTKGALLVVAVWYVIFITGLVVSKLYIRKWCAGLMFFLYFSYLFYEFGYAFGLEFIKPICIYAVNICV